MEENLIFVYAECSELQPRKVGLELLTPAVNIAERTGGKVALVMIGGVGIGETAANLSHCGADMIVYVEGEEYAEYSTDAYTFAAAELVRALLPDGNADRRDKSGKRPGAQTFLPPQNRTYGRYDGR